MNDRDFEKFKKEFKVSPEICGKIKPKVLSYNKDTGLNYTSKISLVAACVVMVIMISAIIFIPYQNQKKNNLLPLSTSAPINTKDSANYNFSDIIGSSQVNHVNAGENRICNMAIATECINETIIVPGQSFSFNNIVGDTTSGKGYKPAAVYDYDGSNVVLTYGSGVSAVSTALYIAAINTGLDINEKHNHSFPVSYVEEGFDAVALYGVTDLKFTNNLNNPIKISGRMTESRVIFEILGINENEGTVYTFTTEKTDSYTRAGNKYNVYTTYRTKTVNGTVAENKVKFGNESVYIILDDTANKKEQ